MTIVVFLLVVFFVLLVNTNVRCHEFEADYCGKEIHEICHMPRPETYQAVFDVRMCLRGAVETGVKCKDYLDNINPSIIEPCYDEITTTCKNVIPGSYRIRDCLLKLTKTVSKSCAESLSRNDATRTLQ